MNDSISIRYKILFIFFTVFEGNYLILYCTNKIVCQHPFLLLEEKNKNQASNEWVIYKLYIFPESLLPQCHELNKLFDHSTTAGLENRSQANNKSNKESTSHDIANIFHIRISKFNFILFIFILVKPIPYNKKQKGIELLQYLLLTQAFDTHCVELKLSIK